MTKEENLKLWDSLFKTDPDATKSFKRAGGFEGTAIDAYYGVKKATEAFGPVGQGWGAYELENKTYTHTDGQAVWISRIRVWWGGRKENNAYQIEQYGQTMLVVKRRDGTVFIDEEAPKKAFTDGMMKCLSYLGIGGDVHTGLFDDNKYVAERKMEQRKEDEREERKERKAREEQAEREAAEQRDEENKKIAERERKRQAKKQAAESQSNGEDLDEPPPEEPEEEPKGFNRDTWATNVMAELPRLKTEKALRNYYATSVKPTMEELTRGGDREMMEFCKGIQAKVKERLAAVKEQGE